MRRYDYERQLLQQRIDAQRRLTGVELRGVAGGIGKLNRVTRLAREVLPVLRPVTRAVGVMGPNTRRVLLVAIAATAIVPLVRSFLRR